jgi:hypothetical protein
MVEIRVPTLRERSDDVPRLADHFLRRFVRDTGRKIRGFTRSALDKMQAYHWPGNVRELRKVVLTGGSGSDILIGGGTIYDASAAALLAVMAEWERTDVGYLARVQDLFGPGGSGLLNPQATRPSLAVDQFFGGNEMDRFWIQPADPLANLGTGEVVTF